MRHTFRQLEHAAAGGTIRHSSWPRGPILERSDHMSIPSLSSPRGPDMGSSEQPPTILIVDDSQDARLALQTLLSNQGYRLAFAGNGVEGLQKAADLVPDLILLDVMMPGMDGLEVCRRLRATPLLSDVPIIMVTALEDRDMRLQGIRAGADDFVSKRFDSTELRARVR